MSQRIKRAAVLGSGVMGSSIAAHLANIGIPTIMLDIVPRELTEAEEAKGLTLDDKIVRNRIAEQSKKALLKQKPSPITSKKSLDLIVTGNMEDDMEKLADVDWIIEVVVERLDIKKQVFANVDTHRKPGTIVISKQSSISVKENTCKNTSKKRLGIIVTDNMEDDMEKLADVDWIIEVVVERLDIKKQVFANVDTHRKPGTIVTSNTSGISVEAMIEDCSED